MSLPDITILTDIVIAAAQQELVPRFRQVKPSYKDDESILTEADQAMDRHLKHELSQRWPDFPFLSEEMPRHKQRRLLQHADQPLWCLDPLDGSRNFAFGLPSFTVSLALIDRREPVIGVIYDPILDECFHAGKGQGAWLNKRRMNPHFIKTPLNRTLALVDFKRLPKSLGVRMINHTPYGSQRNLGSCAREWAWIAAGRAHVLLHGGQKLWDYAAGVLILSEAGGDSCTLNGERVFKADLDPRSVVASSDPELFNNWYFWLTQG
ncbi:MAG: inositol monophosphatase family protein [Arenicellales bacterium]|nr:inositol monophosphatase family protein [Arenicellales bacterium]